MTLRVGADIGGTFTDIVVEDDHRSWSVKVPTTYAAPEAGVLDGLAQALKAAGRTLRDVSLLVHGTTLATNALIERRGARTALLTTEGFRDVLEMGDEGRFDQYDLKVFKPVPLVPRRLRFTAAERMRHDGSVIAPLDEDGVLAAGRQMREAGVQSVAVAFLHAYANGSHERRAAQILRELLGDVAISLSSEVSPEMREYERVSTTCANAYIQPVMSAYMLRLQDQLRAGGLNGPMVMILSSGSLTTVETASRFPIRLLESGPAGGVVFAAEIARNLNLETVLSFDMGGTTAKFCMIDAGQPKHALSFEVGRTYRFKKGSGFPVRVPVVDLVEIGAGGGSIARLDSVGRITVGPESAGSEPGPACYGRGGARATVTDCDLTLGKLDPVTFAAGSMPLDASAAGLAITADVGRPAELSVEAAAYAITEVVSEAMTSAARVHAAEIGAEVERRTLIAFGGGAPLHAARFADKLGITDIVIPNGAGVGSAIGFLRAPLAFETVRTARLRLPDGDVSVVRRVLVEMEDEATAVVRQMATTKKTLNVSRAAYVRYAGQGHDIAVAFDLKPEVEEFAKGLYKLHAAEYGRIYGRSMQGVEAEVTAWSVRVEEPVAFRGAPKSNVRSYYAGPDATRVVFEGSLGRWRKWPEYKRDALAPGAMIKGPAIISESQTTTVVPAGFDVSVDSRAYLHLRRTKSP